MALNFDLKSPCANCPFRSDTPPYLRYARAAEITHALTIQDQYFPCHKTLNYDNDSEDGEPDERPGTQHCAGALIIAEKSGSANQMTRIHERLGSYSASKLDMDAPVYESFDAFVRAQDDAPEDNGYEHCGVVSDNCIDPAGYGGGGGVAENYDEPTCGPEDECHACGNRMCEECQSSEPNVCVECAYDYVLGEA